MGMMMVKYSPPQGGITVLYTSLITLKNMYMFEFILEFLYSIHTYSLTNIWLNVP